MRVSEIRELVGKYGMRKLYKNDVERLYIGYYLLSYERIPELEYKADDVRDLAPGCIIYNIYLPYAYITRRLPPLED